MGARSRWHAMTQRREPARTAIKTVRGRLPYRRYTVKSRYSDDETARKSNFIYRPSSAVCRLSSALSRLRRADQPAEGVFRVAVEHRRFRVGEQVVLDARE